MYSPPCEADPDKWFIDRDGRKYDDELLVTEDDLRASIARLPEGELPIDEAAALLDALVADKAKTRLVERRHARDACHVECKVRLACLDKALEGKEPYGIWGGYFPEQRRELEREIERRRTRREGGAS